jgi:membrane protein involved in colicin uptake
MTDTTTAPIDTSSAVEAPKEKVPGVGDLAKELIRDGKTNEQVLEAVKAKFPEAKTSMASINWYRNKLRTDGEQVPTARELKADGKAEAKAAKDAEKLAKAEAAKQAKADKAEQKAKDKAEKKAVADKAKADAKAAKDAEKAAGAGEPAAAGGDFLA